MTRRGRHEQTLQHVYGPVPSRRLGQSLGIDPIPHKTCNWNCIYCQLGRTRPVVNVRKEYVSLQTICEQVEIALENRNAHDIDWITFVGSGEPTLNLALGHMIREVKKRTNLPVAVITNGALLHMPDVRSELDAADAVLPSLDAGTPDLYRKINRPHPDVSFERYLDGLIQFGREYTGLLWLEVMLVRGLNDSATALQILADALRKIAPDKIHLNTPTRPPAEAWVRPSDEEGLMRAMAILGGVSEPVHPADGTFERSSDDNLVEALIGIINRHPMPEEEVRRTLVRWAPEAVEQTLSDLKASSQIQTIERYGVRFWCSAGSFFPEEPSDQRLSNHRRQSKPHCPDP